MLLNMLYKLFYRLKNFLWGHELGLINLCTLPMVCIPIVLDKYLLGERLVILVREERT